MKNDHIATWVLRDPSIKLEDSIIVNDYLVTISDEMLDLQTGDDPITIMRHGFRAVISRSATFIESDGVGKKQNEAKRKVQKREVG